MPFGSCGMVLSSLTQRCPQFIRHPSAIISPHFLLSEASRFYEPRRFIIAYRGTASGLRPCVALNSVRSLARPYALLFSHLPLVLLPAVSSSFTCSLRLFCMPSIALSRALSSSSCTKSLVGSCLLQGYMCVLLCPVLIIIP